MQLYIPAKPGLHCIHLTTWSRPHVLSHFIYTIIIIIVSFQLVNNLNNFSISNVLSATYKKLNVHQFLSIMFNDIILLATKRVACKTNRKKTSPRVKTFTAANVVQLATSVQTAISADPPPATTVFTTQTHALVFLTRWARIQSAVWISLRFSRFAEKIVPTSGKASGFFVYLWDFHSSSVEWQSCRFVTSNDPHVFS